MLLVSPDTANRLRESGYLRQQQRSPISLLPQPIVVETIEDITAGGPGSGCHGDNCGRPATGITKLATGKKSTAVLKQYGWTLTKKEFTYSGKQKVGHSTYTHWKHGTIEVHHGNKTFTHSMVLPSAPGGKHVLAWDRPTGKDAVVIEKYLQKLKEQYLANPYSTPKSAPAVEQPKPQAGGTVNIAVPHKYDPEPQFTKAIPADPSLKDTAKELLDKYGFNGKHDNTSDDKTRLEGFGGANIAKWRNEISEKSVYNIATGHYDNPVVPIEKLQETANGKGVYAELAAKNGLGPWDLRTLAQAVKGWTYTGNDSDAGKFRAAAQEVVTGKCCSDKFTKLLEIEHAVTQAKLEKLYPKGEVTLARGVGMSLKPKLVEAKKAGATVVLKTLGAESWTDKPVHDWHWGNMRLSATVPISNVMSSHITSPDLFSAHSSEQEFIVAFPGKQHEYKVSEIHGGY